jgi:hypothetical protein
MGRPLKLSETVSGALKAPATNTTGTIGNTGNSGSTQIQFTGFVTGGSANTGYAIAQKGSKRFRITTGDGTETLQLTAVASGTLTAGQCQLTATDSDGNTYYVSKITSRYVTLTPNDGTQFTTGQRALWVASGSEESGVSVSIPLA